MKTKQRERERGRRLDEGPADEETESGHTLLLYGYTISLTFKEPNDGGGEAKWGRGGQEGTMGGGVGVNTQK